MARYAAMTQNRDGATVPSRWLTAIDSEQMLVKIEFVKGLAFLHCELRSRAKGMRAAAQALPRVKAWLKRMGHNFVFAVVKEDYVAYAEHFGFRRFGELNGNIFLLQEC